MRHDRVELDIDGPVEPAQFSVGAFAVGRRTRTRKRGRIRAWRRQDEQNEGEE
jgi:hypothetical protein